MLMVVQLTHSCALCALAGQGFLLPPATNQHQRRVYVP